MVRLADESRGSLPATWVAADWESLGRLIRECTLKALAAHCLCLATEANASSGCAGPANGP